VEEDLNSSRSHVTNEKTSEQSYSRSANNKTLNRSCCSFERILQVLKMDFLRLVIVFASTITFASGQSLKISYSTKFLK